MLAPFAGLCGSWLCSASFLQIFDLVVQVLAVLLGPRHVLLPASDVLLGLVQLLAENRHLSFQFGDSGSFEVDRVLHGGCDGVAGLQLRVERHDPTVFLSLENLELEI